MDLFRNAKSVRLINYRDKYMVAEADGETVIQDDKRSAKEAVWTVELVEGKNYVRLRSCFGTYLTASSVPLLPGVTARRVVQTSPSYSDPATEWEPLRDGMQVKLRSFWGNFLRPNSGLPPWRNLVTHDISHLPNTRHKLLWDVEIVEKHRTRPPDGKFHRCRSRSYSASMPSPYQNVKTPQDYA